MARPILEDKRDQVIRIRVTKSEKKLLMEKASSCNRNTSDFMRDASLGKKITLGLSVDQKFLVKSFSQLTISLQKISNLIKNTYQAEAVIEENISLQNECRELIDKVYGRVG